MRKIIGVVEVEIVELVSRSSYSSYRWFWKEPSSSRTFRPIHLPVVGSPVVVLSPSSSSSSSSSSKVVVSWDVVSSVTMIVDPSESVTISKICIKLISKWN